MWCQGDTLASLGETGCILLNKSTNMYSTVSYIEAAELCIKATTGI